MDDLRPDELRRVKIRTRLDADEARREARRLAASLGFGRNDIEAIALTASELAMNLFRYASDGEMRFRVVQDGPRRGLTVESIDTGPGIIHLDLAFQDGYSTGGGLGSGLPAARRLMDDFVLTTGPSGTKILASKWLITS